MAGIIRIIVQQHVNQITWQETFANKVCSQLFSKLKEFTANCQPLTSLTLRGRFGLVDVVLAYCLGMRKVWVFLFFEYLIRSSFECFR